MGYMYSPIAPNPDGEGMERVADLYVAVGPEEGVAPATSDQLRKAANALSPSTREAFEAVLGRGRSSSGRKVPK